MPPVPGTRATDFIVVGLRVAIPTGSDLRVVARRFGFRGLLAFLEQHRQILTARAVVSVSPARLLALEKRASVTEFPPTRSLTSYWFLDCSALRARIPQFVRELRRLEEVADAYRQPAVRAPWTPTGANPMRPSQGYLAAAPDGIGAAAGWAVTEGRALGSPTSRRRGAPGIVICTRPLRRRVGRQERGRTRRVPRLGST